MREMIKMVVVLTVLCAFSGGLLAVLRDGTMDRIENQQLAFVKGPAILRILKGATNDPIKDRFKLHVGDTDHSFFVGVLNGHPEAVAFESHGKGFGGDIGLMVGIDTKTDKVLGVGVTTMSETPGMGARALTDHAFIAQFKGFDINQQFKVTADGGQVDALSGATITSRGISAALTDAGKLYEKIKPQLTEKLKAYK